MRQEGFCTGKFQHSQSIIVSPMSALSYLVAIVGAGPAGLFAARKLAEHGVRVVLFNRDVKPGGLAEYGIYPDKLKMKRALREQFRQILSSPLIDYYGNVTVCSEGSVTLEVLLSAFHAVLVATGAQGTKWLRVPGETLPGVYHAKNFVYHYNRLPPFSQRNFLIGRRVAIVGGGNVMIDVARYLIRERKVDEVVAVVRRGPAEVKFSRKELGAIAANLDLQAIHNEFARLDPILKAVGQDGEVIRQTFLMTRKDALPPVSDTRFRFEFLASPVRVLGDLIHGVSALKVEENVLVRVGDQVKARGTSLTRHIEVDTVIFAVGDTVERAFCLPVYGDVYATTPAPRFPIRGISFEACNPDMHQPAEGVFLAGWARQPSTGQVGYAKLDSEMAVEAILRYLQTQRPIPQADVFLRQFDRRLEEIQRPLVRKTDLTNLEEAERARAAQLSVEDFKFPTNEEMFAAMGLSS